MTSKYYVDYLHVTIILLYSSSEVNFIGPNAIYVFIFPYVGEDSDVSVAVMNICPNIVLKAMSYVVYDCFFMYSYFGLVDCEKYEPCFLRVDYYNF